MGYGIIHVKGSQLDLISMGAIKFPSAMDVYERLEKIHHKVTQLIATHHPDSFAIEAPFFGKNVQSMLKLGRAQGVAIAAAMQAGLTVSEYSPKKVKQSITGNGNAGKEQVMKMLQHLVKFKQEPKYLDASDALAVAICHHFQQRNAPGEILSKVSGWKSFIAQNPKRVKAG